MENGLRAMGARVLEAKVWAGQCLERHCANLHVEIEAFAQEFGLSHAQLVDILAPLPSGSYLLEDECGYVIAKDVEPSKFEGGMRHVVTV